MKVLAFAASSSSKSINKQLVTYAAGLVPNADVEVIDLNDYEMPIYSSDREEAGGVPDLAQAFKDKIAAADAVMISFAEHNGSYSAAYKNTFDWVSRLEGKVYADKAMVLLATSPGAGGAQSVLAAAAGSMPHFGAEVKATVSVPSFYDAFDAENGVMKDAALDAELKAAAATLV